MEKVRTAVIGCGKVGHFHANALKNLPNSELVACFGRDPIKTNAFASQYGIKSYTNLKKMIKEQNVQAVAICTPHPAHAQYAIQCCELGVHVAIEKPLASSLEDCDAIIKAKNENNVIGTTICQRRFYKPSIRVKQAIVDGKIGKPILGTVNMLGWRSMEYYASDPWRGTWKGEGGGVLINQAPHQIDLLLWYMGDIDEMYGMWDTLNHPDLEVEDTAMAVIKFKNGAFGNIVVSNSQNPALFGNVRVHGSNGASIGVQTDGGAMFIAGVSGIAEPPVNDIWTIPREAELLPQYKKEDSEYFNSHPEGNYYHILQLKDFLDAIQNKKLPLVSLEDGRKTVELITGIYRSYRDHKPIKFPLQPEYSNDYDGRFCRKTSSL